jgi:hypothetical protein
MARDDRHRWTASVSELRHSLQQKADYDKHETELLPPVAASISVTHGSGHFPGSDEHQER